MRPRMNRPRTHQDAVDIRTQADGEPEGKKLRRDKVQEDTVGIKTHTAEESELEPLRDGERGQNEERKLAAEGRRATPQATGDIEEVERAKKAPIDV